MSVTVDRFELVERGSNSEIFRSKDLTGKLNLILKTVDVALIKEAEHLLKESQLLLRLDSPYVVKPLSFKANQPLLGLNRHVMILPQAKHSSLLKFVKSRKLQAAEVRLLFRQLAKGVAYLHDNNLVHRDLKLENVLVFEESGMAQLKLSDFGFAESFNSQEKPRLFCSLKGTRRGYMAPEIHTIFQTKQPYDARRCDIFALGVMLFAMVFKKLPFQFATKQNIEGKHCEFFASHNKEITRRETEPAIMMEDIKHLLSRMLAYTPEDRPTIEEVLDHPWLKGEQRSVPV